MAIDYKSIKSLPSTGSLANGDMFLIAKNDSSNLGYTTYQTTFAQLSSSLVDKIKEITIGNVVHKLSALDASKTDWLVAADVIWQMLNMIDSISAHYLCKDDLSGTSTIRQNVNFSKQVNLLSTSTCQSLTSFDDECSSRIVNLDSMDRYFEQEKGSTYIYRSGKKATRYQIVKNSNTSAYSVYNQESEYSTQLNYTSTGGHSISVDLSSIQNGPVAHYIQQDCTVVITSKGQGSSLWAFTLHPYSSSNLSATLESGEKIYYVDDVEWSVNGKRRLRQYDSSYLSSGFRVVGHMNGENDVMVVPMRAKSILCIYDTVVKSDNAFIRPKFAKGNWAVGDTFRIEEYYGN